MIFTFKSLLLYCILNTPSREQSWQYVWHFGGCCCLKSRQYDDHKMDNQLLILLPVLLSAYLHQGKSGYVPGNLAVHQQPFRCDTASFLIFAHILQVIKHNTVDGVQHFKFVYSSTTLVWKQILWISWYSSISGK